MKYVPPAGGAADDSYVDGDRSAGIEGSVVPAAAIEDVMRELVHLVVHSGQTPDGADKQQVRKAVENLIAAAIGSGDTSNFVTFPLARARLPIYPEIVSADGRINVTSPAAGTVRVPSGVTFMHRGIFPVTTEETDFSTTASKTYHLRWNATDGLSLEDLADSGYNPSVLPESDPTFDSTYDDMLIARVVTSSSNVATITNLASRASQAVDQTVSGAASIISTGPPSGNDGAEFTGAVTLDWSRTPVAVVSGNVRQGTTPILQGYANRITEKVVTRYGISATVVSDWDRSLVTVGASPAGEVLIQAFAR
ncbi:hypothetical protein AY599_18270 [Leptolyngbya valderiana BDU 20041]|nr:hypothetical protein AY599_18270 [Leptolyngbya valderiana BDU 20041]